jgi:hypothetical protein
MTELTRGRAFIHIGTEKTGTKTLQQFLTTNSARLKSLGFMYPSNAEKPYFYDVGHFPIAAYLLEEEVDFISEEKKRTLPLVFDSLSKDIGSAENNEENIILSCEHFSSRLQSVKQLARLRAALGAREITIICYVREQSELTLSSYSTFVRTGNRDRLSIESVVPDNIYFNPLKILELWSSEFGADNVLVRPYSRQHLVGADIRRDFCEIIGVDEQGMLFLEDLNTSLDASQLEALRFVNCALPTFDEQPQQWRRGQELRTIIQKYLPPGIPLSTLLSISERKVIKHRFRWENEQLAKRYMNCPFPVELKNDRLSTEANIKATWGAEDDLANTLRQTVLNMAEAELAEAELAEAEWAEAKLAGTIPPAAPENGQLTFASHLVDFRKSTWPGVVSRSWGLSYSEPWGAWSSGKIVTLEFAIPLPNRLAVHLVAQAFGPVVGKEFIGRVGDHEIKFTLGASAEERVLEFGNPKKLRIIEFEIPSPASPKNLGLGSDDRTLGIGFIELRIATSLFRYFWTPTLAEPTIKPGDDRLALSAVSPIAQKP